MQICKLRLSLIDLQICPLGKFEHLSELLDCVCKLAKLRLQVTNDLYRELFSDLKERAQKSFRRLQFYARKFEV